MAIGGLLEPVLKQAGVYVEVAFKNALKSPLVSRITTHLLKNKWWYIGGAGGTATVGGAGKIYGDYRERKGVKKGMVKQAAIDEEKARKDHETHERDRQKWKENDKAKDELIEELIKDK